MLVGVIGKPNVGKSTFFSAATMKDVPIADYPFTTIKPNVGVAYLRTECVCMERGVTDNPRNSLCVDGVRLIPVRLIDVAGLVEGASQGKGLGNQFLDDIRQADALIHVVDASGSTDMEGRKVPPGSHDPILDVDMVEKEFDLWVYGLIKRDWEKTARTTEQTGGKILEHLAARLTGLSITLTDVEQVALRLKLKAEKPTLWTDEQLHELVTELRRSAKPSLISANKADLPTAGPNIERLRSTGRKVVACASEAELLLRKAAEHGLVSYVPGDSDFKVAAPEKLSAAQLNAIKMVEDRVMRPLGGTGVQQAINEAYFSLLNAIVVFPVEDDTRLADKNGAVLPDAYVMKGGSTALDLARMVHSDLAEGFLYAIDARTGKRLAAEHRLQNRDIVKIVSTKSLK
ncbi:MAG TPA: redox-regulated ATPase YchF [Nitrososphaerales archaeon]|nr:redox-regulated ATPase YchF [Nitrososphaerales archaeon]